jgi:HEAT repeat protein
VAALADLRPEVRRAAARALKRLDTGTRLDTWLSAIQDPDWLVRAAAIEGLSRYPEPAAEDALLAALQDPVWLNRYQALKLLETRPSERALAAMLAALETDKELGPWLGPAIARFGPAALPALLDRLAGAPPWRQLAIASALGALDDDRARAALVGLVGHPDAEIEAAIHTHGPAMRTRLAAALCDPDWMVRWHAAKLLGQLGDPAASISLLPLLADSRPDVRLATLDALKRLADPRTEDDLRRCLQDPSWHFRLGAVEALAALDTEGALEALVDALADKRSEIVQAARRALQARGDRAEDALAEGLLRHPECYDEIAWLLKALKGARA